MLGKMFKMMKKGNKGFTLVELMVVVVIIGVLTAIAVPVYNNVTTKAKINTIASNLRIINGAISQYKTNVGSDPGDLDKLVPDYLQAIPTGPNSIGYKYQAATAAGEDTSATPAQAILSDDAADSGITGITNGMTLAQVIALIED